MSKIQSSAEDIVINADGANNDIKFQSNGSEVAQIDQAGVISSTGGSRHADNVKAKFGTGNDLEIYHDGSNSIIIDGGVGDLKLRSNGTNVDIGNANGEVGLRYVSDGAVELYHNNVKKFETTAEGITVTGNTIVSEGSSLKFGGNNARIMGHSGNNRVQFLAGGYEQMRLQGGLFRIGNIEASQDDGKLSVSEAKNYSGGIARQQINVRDTQAATVTDNGGAITFSGKYTSTNYTSFAQIEGVKANNTDNNYQGGLKFSTRSAGSSMDVRGRWDADGIKFGGDTAAANGLSDYEKGLFTPVFKDSNNATVSGNLSAATYTKIGNVCSVQVYWTKNNTSHSNIVSMTLPFQSISAGNQNCRSVGNVMSYNAPIGNKSNNTIIVDGTSIANFWQLRDNATSYFFITIDNGSEMFFTWTYQTET